MQQRGITKEQVDRTVRNPDSRGPARREGAEKLTKKFSKTRRIRVIAEEHSSFIRRLEDHMGCVAAIDEYDKADFLQARDEVISLVKQEIDASRPLMLYFDNGDDWGHAAVLDGYVERGDQFIVHLNMGWGGRYDGWYDLFHRIMGVRDKKILDEICLRNGVPLQKLRKHVQ